MAFLDFIKRKLTEPRKQPEDFYEVCITSKSISVAHPKFGTELIDWSTIDEVKIITTDQGPFQPDVWLALFGKDSKCLIPQGAKGYDEVYEIVSKYQEFNFENVIKAMGSTENKEFLVWTRKA